MFEEEFLKYKSFSKFKMSSTGTVYIETVYDKIQFTEFT